MKTTLLSVLALLVAGVNASFDLMLIPGSDGTINRYDPVNRVQLGSYAGVGNNLIAADNRGIAYGTETVGSVHMTKYSTGDTVGWLNTASGIRGAELAGNSLYTVLASGIRRTNTSTGALSSATLDASVAYSSLAIYGNTIIAIGINASNTIAFQTGDINTMAFNPVQTSQLNTVAGSRIGKAAVTFNPVTGLPGLMFSFNSSVGTLSYGRLTLATNGQISNANGNFGNLLNYGDAVTMPTFMAGHGGSFWVYGQDVSGGANVRVTRVIATSGIPGFSSGHIFTAPGGSFTGISPYSHTANVVAPEPGTMIVLGFGLTAFRRRRPKS